MLNHPLSLTTEFSDHCKNICSVFVLDLLDQTTQSNVNRTSLRAESIRKLRRMKTRLNLSRI